MSANPKASIFIRMIALMTSGVFLLSNMTWAQPVPASTGEVPVQFAKLDAGIKVPEGLGSVQEHHQIPGSQKAVVIIQDAHAIPDAQRSIQKLMNYFESEYGVSIAAVEGAASELDARLLKGFPDQNILKQTLDNYFDRGELTGASAAAILNQNPSRYFGVEDWNLYEQGLALYSAAMDRETELNEIISNSGQALAKKKRETYSQELLEVDQVYDSFSSNGTDLFTALKEFAGFEKPEPGSELALLLEAGQREGAVDSSADAETAKIAAEIKKHLNALPSSEENRRILAEYHEKFQAYQTGQLTGQGFALFLSGLAEQAGLSYETSENLAAVMRQEKRMRDIQGTKLFEDLDFYVRHIKEGLFRSDEERRLDQEGNELKLLERFIALELSEKDWSGIQPLIERLPDPLTGEQIRAHVLFYENAEARDKVIFTRLNKLMEKSQSGSALLVTGGFHAGSLKRSLEAAGISYVLIVPRIQNLPEETRYRENMKGNVSWKNYLEIKDGRIDLHKAFVRGMRDELLKAADEPAGKTLKLWRDEIIRNLAADGKIERAGDYTSLLDEAVRQDGMIRQPDKIDQFISGLKQLESSGQLNAQGILNLLKAPTILQAMGGTPAELGSKGLRNRVRTPLGTYQMLGPSRGFVKKRKSQAGISEIRREDVPSGVLDRDGRRSEVRVELPLTIGDTVELIVAIDGKKLELMNHISTGKEVLREAVNITNPAEGFEIRLGREPEAMQSDGNSNVLIVPLNNIRVSAFHAVLRFENNQWFLIDQESTNGTEIKGRSVKQNRVNLSAIKPGTSAAAPANVNEIADRLTRLERVYNALRIGNYGVAGVGATLEEVQALIERAKGDNPPKGIKHFMDAMGWLYHMPDSLAVTNAQGQSLFSRMSAAGKFEYRISLNVQANQGLIEVLDDLLSEQVQGRLGQKPIVGVFKIDPEAAQWFTRHDTATLYFAAVSDQEAQAILRRVLQAVRRFVRVSNFTLPGTLARDADGQAIPQIALEKELTSAETQTLLTDAREVDLNLAKAFKIAMRANPNGTFTVSTGQAAAMRKMISAFERINRKKEAERSEVRTLNELGIEMKSFVFDDGQRNAELHLNQSEFGAFFEGNYAENLAAIQKALTQNYAAVQNQRSLYVELPKPFTTSDGRRWTRVYLKGILFDATKPLETHEGIYPDGTERKGFESFNPEVSSEGQFKNVGPDLGPDGAMTLDKAAHEFEMTWRMGKSAKLKINKIYTSGAMGYGEFTQAGLEFKGKKLGFVMLGIDDEMIHAESRLEETPGLQKTLGGLLRQVHDAGFTYYSLHHGNVSLNVNGSKTYLHDLTTVQAFQDIELEKPKMAGLRLKDFIYLYIKYAEPFFESNKPGSDIVANQALTGLIESYFSGVLDLQDEKMQAVGRILFGDHFYVNKDDNQGTHRGGIPWAVNVLRDRLSAVGSTMYYEEISRLLPFGILFALMIPRFGERSGTFIRSEVRVENFGELLQGSILGPLFEDEDMESVVVSFDPERETDQGTAGGYLVIRLLKIDGSVREETVRYDPFETFYYLRRMFNLDASIQPKLDPAQVGEQPGKGHLFIEYRRGEDFVPGETGFVGTGTPDELPDMSRPEGMRMFMDAPREYYEIRAQVDQDPARPDAKDIVTLTKVQLDDRNDFNNRRKKYLIGSKIENHFDLKGVLKELAESVAVVGVPSLMRATPENPAFIDLVKSEIQDENFTLLRIGNQYAVIDFFRDNLQGILEYLASPDAYVHPPQGSAEHPDPQVRIDLLRENVKAFIQFLIARPEVERANLAGSFLTLLSLTVPQERVALDFYQDILKYIFIEAGANPGDASLLKAWHDALKIQHIDRHMKSFLAQMENNFRSEVRGEPTASSLPFSANSSTQLFIPSQKLILPGDVSDEAAVALRVVQQVQDQVIADIQELERLAFGVEGKIETMGLDTFAAVIRQMANQYEYQKVRWFLNKLAAIAEVNSAKFKGDVALAFDLDPSEGRNLQDALGQVLDGLNVQAHLLLPHGLDVKLDSNVDAVIHRVRAINQLHPSQLMIARNANAIATVSDLNQLTNPRLYGIRSAGKEDLDENFRNVMDLATRTLVALLLGQMVTDAATIRNIKERGDVQKELNLALFGTALDELTYNAIQFSEQGVTIHLGNFIQALMTAERSREQIRKSA